jgi:hypothetical protein
MRSVRWKRSAPPRTIAGFLPMPNDKRVAVLVRQPRLSSPNLVTSDEEIVKGRLWPKGHCGWNPRNITSVGDACRGGAFNNSA